jgi:hypothetical protein
MEKQGVVTCAISEDGRPLGQFTTLPTTSTCVLGGAEYQLNRYDTGRFTMTGPAGETVVADRTAPREVTVLEQPTELRLWRVGTLRRRWDLHHAGEVRGWCRLTAFGATADLPADLALPTRLFLFYVAIMADRKLETNAASWF